MSPTTWLLVMSSLGLHGPATFSDGDYRSLDACQRTGQNMVVLLNEREIELEKQFTSVHKNLQLTTKAYSARIWEFECFPTDKG
jgi:hypothetical protein